MTVRNTRSCSEDDFLLSYLDILYCTIKAENATMVVLGVLLFLCMGAYLFSLLATAADSL